LSKEEAMPLIQVKYATPKGAEQNLAIAAKASALAAEHLHKDPQVTAVIAERVPAENWFCAGRSLAEQDLASFWLDIKITDSTNTKDEKATFIARTFEAMQAILGRLHEESYVLVHDVHGYAYGFGGQTQEQRYVEAKLAVPKMARSA
jgi:4-oxalocrotonate tautomerase